MGDCNTSEGSLYSSTPDRKPCGCLKAVECSHSVEIPPVIRATSAEPQSAVEKTLSERGSRYGDFADNAWVSQQLEEVVLKQSGYDNLDFVHREAIKYIFQKISRIVNGDPNYLDNWHDIQGYAKLVEDRLPKEALK